MLRARLDTKTGERVFCGKQTCRGEFGTLSESAGYRMLQLGPGWGLKGDTWRLTNYAEKRVRQGLPPKNRRSVDTEDDRDATTGEITGVQRRHAVEIPLMPAKAECPACGFIGLLDPVELRVTHPMNDPERRPALDQAVRDWPKPSES